MPARIRHLHRNLLLTADGAAWAVWRLHGLEYGHASAATKRAALDVTAAQLRALAGDALLLGLCTAGDPTEVVRRMVDGVDLDAHPGWAQVCEASLDLLEDLALVERTRWLAVPLPALGRGRQLRGAAGAAAAAVGERLGLPAPPVDAGTVTLRLGQADRVGRRLPGQLGPRPGTPAEVRWLYQRAARRGLLEPHLAAGLAGASRVCGAALRGPSHAWVDDVLVDEGGRTEESGRGAGVRNPFEHRYLKVLTEDGASYQCFLALAETPGDGMAFPGSEWLLHADDFGFGVDWAVRLRTVDREAAQAKNRRQTRELAAQVDQYTRTDAHGALVDHDVPEELALTRDALDEYRTRLAANSSEVEVQATAIFCVWGACAEAAQQHAEILAAAYAASEYRLARPIGGQEDLYWDMLPGPATSRTARDYTQYTLSRDYAMAMPFASIELGDPRGALLGFNLAGGGVRPVLSDPSWGPRIDASASVGIVAELGAGKSVTLKTYKTHVICRGGRALTIDRTKTEEWVSFARACPWRAEIIRVGAAPEISLDPLRIFPPAVAGRVAQSFLTVLLGVRPTDPVGVLLAEQLDPRQLAELGDTPTLRRLVTSLERLGARDPAAREAGRLLGGFARHDIGQVVFDDTVPALRLPDADDIVFATSAVELPTSAELEHQHLFERLPLEKLLGRALLYLIAAVCREVAFGDTTRFAGMFLDETHHLTRTSTEGQQVVLDFIRDGRKHDAGVFLGSHDPDDFGSETVRGLLSTRILMRQRDRALAAKSLAFLDLDPDDEQLVDLVTKDLSPLDVPDDQRRARAGEALMRDMRGRVGKLRILIPPVPGIAEAILTTPGHGAPDRPRRVPAEPT